MHKSKSKKTTRKRSSHKRTVKKSHVKRQSHKKSQKKSQKKPKKKSDKKKRQKGKGYGDPEYLKAMRRPIESPMDNVQPAMHRLMKDHDLSMKDALFIGVAEILYPKQAKTYYDTVDQLVKKGYSVKDAAKIAFGKYMEFYEAMSQKKVVPKEKKSMLKKIFSKKESKSSGPKVLETSLISP